MPCTRAAGQRLPPGRIRATRPRSVRSGRHWNTSSHFARSLKKHFHQHFPPAMCGSSTHMEEAGGGMVSVPQPHLRCPGQRGAGFP